MQELLAKKFLIEINGEISQGGRKASYLALNKNAGFIGITYFSATSNSVAVANLQGEIVKSKKTKVDISDGPKAILPKVINTLVDMLNEIPKNKRLRVVVGVP